MTSIRTDGVLPELLGMTSSGPWLPAFGIFSVRSQFGGTLVSGVSQPFAHQADSSKLRKTS
jgi:hypothetical protein